MDMMRRGWIWAAGTALGLSTAGCVEQIMSVDSDPPGALVYMNDQEVGRTPFTRDFTWHGNYDVQVRMEGYQTIKTATRVKAPLWNTVPFDLFAEVIPLRFHERQHLTYSLKSATTEPTDTHEILTRAENLEARLEASQYPPTTKPTTKPSKPKKSTK
jgi:hypothetical protein